MSMVKPSSVHRASLDGQQTAHWSFSCYSAFIVCVCVCISILDGTMALILTDVFVSFGFLRLSASLFRHTGNGSYIVAARAAADFVVAHMYDGQVIVDGVRLSDSRCATVPGYRSSVSGFAVHAFGDLSMYDIQYRNL